ncbi:guanine nucleotide-binding protein subunit alpha [Diaporthe australafricana]|uniref:Guanine nucleotide-binding protein subunit alpha n=1 Tax=Diaporthe australafricana TaxID=127596 RepID=A0ABR3VUP7_9PEZI
MLLLGSSESGKSTLLQDMRIHFGEFYDPEETMNFTETVQTNVIQGIRVILEEMKKLGIPLQHDTNERHAQDIFMQAAENKGICPAQLTSAVVVSELWADAGVQESYRCRHQYLLSENVSHFASHIERLASPEYVPSQEDILRSYFPTVGITETSFLMDDVTVLVHDFSGLRSQRRKWIYAFENVDSIVFTVDASAYCRLLPDNGSCNQMQDQITLWESIVGSRWFTKTDFVLVFTKIDCLPETIGLSPISDYFPDFPDSDSSVGMNQLIDSYLGFLKERFMSLLSHETRQRTKVVFADLVHVDEINPASLVLETLKVPDIPVVL